MDRCDNDRISIIELRFHNKFSFTAIPFSAPASGTKLPISLSILFSFDIVYFYFILSTMQIVCNFFFILFVWLNISFRRVSIAMTSIVIFVNGKQKKGERMRTRENGIEEKFHSFIG